MLHHSQSFTPLTYTHAHALAPAQTVGHLQKYRAQIPFGTYKGIKHVGETYAFRQ